jgi:hypothetical protein
MYSYMASHGSCFMLTWTIFKNYLLKVGLTQNRKTISLRTDYNCWFILFYHAWGPMWIEIHSNQRLVEGPCHIWLHTTLEDPWPHIMILEVCWDGLWTLSFGLSQFHGRGSWIVCEVVQSCRIFWTPTTYCTIILGHHQSSSSFQIKFTGAVLLQSCIKKYAKISASNCVWN